MAKQQKVQKRALSSSNATSSSAEYLQTRPFAATNNSIKASPNIQKQSQKTSKIGHSFGQIPIQPKLKIGEPGDKYEQEADNVAAQVVQKINEPSTQRQELGEEEELQMKPESGTIQREELPDEDELQMKPESGTIQREELPDEDELQMKPESGTIQREELPEEDELQMKPESGTIQRDELPEEDELQMKPESGTIQRDELPEEDELQMKPESGTIQRDELPEEDELQMKPQTIQRQPDVDSGTASDEFETSLNNSRSGGQSLQPELRMKMESAMGADFSGVKVHTDTKSDQLNKSIQAKAFTTGKDVFFRQGEYNPGTQGGQELIAHELTHVVQQGGDTVRRSPGVSNSKKQPKAIYDLSAKAAKEMAKKRYKANNENSLLTKTEYDSIGNKSSKWLNEAGFKDVKKVESYKDFKNWENEEPAFMMQVVTHQYTHKMKNTPGYHKAISALGKKEEIYKNDAKVWEKTLNSPNPNKLKSKTKKELLNRNNAAMKILKRIFITLQKGLKFSNDGLNFQDWQQPVAVALSHGGRVNIRIPQVGKNEKPDDFFNWLTGGEYGMKNSGMHKRLAATHRIDIGKNKKDKRGSFEEKGGKGAYLRSISDGTTHYGLDLPVGGLGNLDMNGNVILPNGSYGHLYIGYKPPTTQRDGGLLIGCETDAPGMTNSLGHKHDWRAKSAKHGPTGGLKDDKIGKKRGGMLVDLSKISTDEKNWMQQLKDMEEKVNEGKITSKELVGKRDKVQGKNRNKGLLTLN